MKTAPKHPTPYPCPEELFDDKRVPSTERPWIIAWLSRAVTSRTSHYKLREEIASHGTRVPFAYFRDALKYLHSSAGPLRSTERHLASELAQHEQFFWLGTRDWRHKGGLTKWDAESVTLLKLATQARNKLSVATRAHMNAIAPREEPERESDLE